MAAEEQIMQELGSAFIFLKDRFVQPRPRRIFVEVGYDKFLEVFTHCARRMKFNMLCAITGLDNKDTLEAIYHLAQEDGIVLSVKTAVPKENPVLKSVVSYFPCAQVYERELVDLLGFTVEGLPDGSRYPLTDDWPVNEHPLRKDWHPHDAAEQGGGPDA
jgi:membrane-bound hydrogenase subunit beta